MDEIRCSIEFRADEDRLSPGRLTGTLLEYEQRASDRPEIFKTGALSWPAAGVVLNIQHDRKQVLTRFVPVIEGRRVLIDVPLPDTSAGRDTAVLVKNGTFSGLSLEFRARSEGMRGPLREVRAADLVGAAIVDSAAYKGSLEVRHKGHSPRPTGFTLWL